MNEVINIGMQQRRIPMKTFGKGKLVSFCYQAEQSEIVV